MSGLGWALMDSLVRMFLKNSLQAERITLCARRLSEYASSSSVVRVQSKNWLWSRIPAKERDTLASKSFHRRQNFSEEPMSGKGDPQFSR